MLQRLRAFLSFFLHRKKIFILLVIILAAVAIFKPFGFFGDNSASKYKTETMALGELSTTINVSGVVQAENLATMPFLSAGRVSYVGFKVGDHVKAGDVIASLDTTEAQANVVKAQAALKSSQSTLNKVLDDIHLAQYGNGGFSNVGSANETETQKAGREEAQAAEISAEQDLQKAEKELQWESIIAPFEGVISDISSIAVGENVSATTNSSVTVVGDGKLKFVANVDETQYGRLKMGQTGTISLDAFPDETFSGAITKIGVSAITLSTGGSVIPVDLTLSDDSRLKNGLNGDVDFNITGKTNVLTLPLSAVKKDSSGKYVYLLRNNKPVRQNVTTGDSLGTKVEITSGLKVGDTVILSGVSQ